MLYFGSDLRACFGETLARFRPDTSLLAVIGSEWRGMGFMDVGSVTPDLPALLAVAETYSLTIH